ncbi:MAG: insulinase family protein [Burkholderiales bacterium]|nr:insulinase family protein [Burkholderiales bacterium]
MYFKYAPLTLAVMLGLALPAWADAAPATPTPAAATAGPTKIVTVEGITEYRLPNGLRILLAPDATKPSTTVNVTYLVGSRMEKYGETGMAHLLEHLMFKGTPSLPGKTIVEEFGKRGMRYNGTTNFDRTNYHETFAANDDNLDWALRLEADRMVHSNIWKSDLDSEMTVVRNEMEMGENSPGRILWQKSLAAAYQWHNYGKDTIGARADVENVNIAHLQAFYRTYYQPDNAVVLVSGKFDEAKTLARIASYFGPIAKPTREIEPLWTVEPVQDGARAVTLQRVGDNPIIESLYHIAEGASDDYVYMSILAQIMGDTPNGRLYKALVEKKLATSVGADAQGMHDPGVAGFFVSLDKRQSRDKAVAALNDALENLAQHPITEAELKRAKVSILNDFEKTLNDPNAFGVALSESIAEGDWRLFFLERDRVEQATVADINRVAVNYLKASNRTLGQFVPTEKPSRTAMPAPVDVSKLVANYTGRAAMAEGEVFDPSPENIEHRTTRTKLANGLQLAELPKLTRGNTVHGALVLNIGDEKSLQGKKYIAEATANMLLRGAGKLSRKEIADRLDELKTQLAISGDGGQVDVSFETRRDKLPELLTLLRDLLRAPTFPASEFDQMKTEWVAGVEEERHQPQSLAQNAIGRIDNPYSRGDLRYAETFDEQEEGIKALKLTDLRGFHTQFYGADHAQMALVGDFDRAEVEKQLAQLFGDWHSHAAYARVGDPYRPSKEAEKTLETPDKANAFYIAAQRMPIKDDDSDFIALTLGNRILGGGSLKSRIADRLRQKDGISYSAGSWLQPNSFEANSSLGFYAIYAPQNLGKLKQGVSDELARLLKDGVTDQELAEAKSGMLQEQTLARSQDGTLAAVLRNQLRLGRTMAFSANREAQIKAATVEQVNAALRKYLQVDQLVQVYAGDFANAAKKPANPPVSDAR